MLQANMHFAAIFAAFFKLHKMFTLLHRSKLNVLVKILGLSSARVCKSCSSRQKLSNEYLLAKIGGDAAENEPLKV